MQSFILGLAGGTGAGKSTLAEGLNSELADQTLTIHLDDYFRPPPELPRFADHLNFDHPDAVYSEQLLEDLVRLKHGQSSEITQKDPDGMRVYKEWGPRKRLLKSTLI